MKTMYTHRVLVVLFLATFFLPFRGDGQGAAQRQELNLNQVYSQYNLSGEGALVVIMDRGIDYTHPDFIDENGNTRIAYIFDLIDDSGANDPGNPYGAGTIYTEADINQALANGSPQLSTDRGGHGTATTGIVCGDGSGTTDGAFQGVAFGARIISIKVTHDPFPAFGSEPGQSGVFDPNDIPIALDFAADKIAELGLPSVSLLNLGSIGGPTDGTSLICREIDDFVALGHPFLCGVGDDGGADNYAAGTVPANQSETVEINKGETGFLRMDLWYSEDNRFAVT
ncbi:MAG: S8 family serine peptidase, partial [Bacteroidota bacterium]